MSGDLPAGWVHCPICNGAGEYRNGTGLCHDCGFLWVGAEETTMDSLDELTRMAHATGQIEKPTKEHIRAIRRN